MVDTRCLGEIIMEALKENTNCIESMVYRQDCPCGECEKLKWALACIKTCIRIQIDASGFDECEETSKIPAEEFEEIWRIAKDVENCK